MATSRMDSVLQYLRRATLPRGQAALSDGQLLEQFIRSHDAAAFENLVRRHGPMVIHVAITSVKYCTHLYHFTIIRTQGL
jgi:hypothetical protein